MVYQGPGSTWWFLTMQQKLHKTSNLTAVSEGSLPLKRVEVFSTVLQHCCSRSDVEPGQSHICVKSLPALDRWATLPSRRRTDVIFRWLVTSVPSTSRLQSAEGTCLDHPRSGQIYATRNCIGRERKTHAWPWDVTVDLNLFTSHWQKFYVIQQECWKLSLCAHSPVVLHVETQCHSVVVRGSRN